MNDIYKVLKSGGKLVFSYNEFDKKLFPPLPIFSDVKRC